MLRTLVGVVKKARARGPLKAHLHVIFEPIRDEQMIFDLFTYSRGRREEVLGKITRKRTYAEKENIRLYIWCLNKKVLKVKI